MTSQPRGPGAVRLLPDVAAALRGGHPVVALESSVISQGLPVPANRDAVNRMVRAILMRGAVPALTAVARGIATAGLEHEELERFLRRDGVIKVSARDLALAMARQLDGATTVAGALALATNAGISVLATGGIGGVHRTARDESADLLEMTRSPVVVVCSGAKSILDLEATHERLETLGIPVLGYRTSELPGFFAVHTGISLSARVESPAEVAGVFRAQRSLGLLTALVVVQPPPADVALPQHEVEAAVDAALARARAEGVHGAKVTPFLLQAIERETGGRTLGANLALLERNSALAAEIAVEISR